MYLFHLQCSVHHLPLLQSNSGIGLLEYLHDGKLKVWGHLTPISLFSFVLQTHTGCLHSIFCCEIAIELF